MELALQQKEGFKTLLLSVKWAKILQGKLCHCSFLLIIHDFYLQRALHKAGQTHCGSLSCIFPYHVGYRQSSSRNCSWELLAAHAFLWAMVGYGCGLLFFSSAGLHFCGTWSEEKHQDDAFQNPCSSPAKTALLKKPWLCMVERTFHCKHSQSLGHESKQSVPVESILSILICLGHVQSGGKCGAGHSTVYLSFLLFHLDGHVSLYGDDSRWCIKFEQYWKKKENSDVLPVVLLVVFMDLSSRGTGTQGHVWSSLKRNVSLYSLGDRAQRSNVSSNHCLSV